MEATVHSFLPLLVDIVLGAILFIGTMFGLKRGLIRSLAGIVVLIVALVGSCLIAKHFTPAVTAWLEPRMETRMIEKYAGEVKGDYSIAQGLKDRLRELNIGSDFLNELEEKMGDKMQEVKEDTVRLAATNLAGTVAYAMLFGLSFGILSLLLGVLVNALDIFSKIPVIHLLNHLGGAVLGLLKDALILYVVVWVLRRLGIFFTEDMIENSTILRFFANFNPLDLLTR